MHALLGLHKKCIFRFITIPSLILLTQLEGLLPTNCRCVETYPNHDFGLKFYVVIALCDYYTRLLFPNSYWVTMVAQFSTLEMRAEHVLS